MKVYTGYITQNKNEKCLIFDDNDLTETELTFEQYKEMFHPNLDFICHNYPKQKYMQIKNNIIKTKIFEEETEKDAMEEFKKQGKFIYNRPNNSDEFSCFLYKFRINKINTLNEKVKKDYEINEEVNIAPIKLNHTIGATEKNLECYSNSWAQNLTDFFTPKAKIA